MNESIFRANDVRGIVERDFTDDVVLSLGKAYGTYMHRRGHKSLVVGHDLRLSSPHLAGVFMDGMLSTDVHVVFIGQVTTPALYFAILHWQLDGGVMITGSHNPKPYNGFKMCEGMDSVYGEEIQKLKKMILENDFDVAQGDREERDIMPDYLAMLRGKFSFQRKLKIVIDAGNATAGPIAPQLWRDYGHEVQAPSAILRFALPRTGVLGRLMGRGWKRFEAGDLLGVLPQGSDIARFYSLASGTRDGFVEICVKKHTRGLCSGQLLDLQIGDSITAFIRPNPDFRPAANKKPVILIGAGTGIGPLAGFIRANQHQPMQLYFGIRHPKSDYLYDKEISDWQAQGKLSAVQIAASRTQQAAYVQNLLRHDAARLAELIENGAQILVCGGRDMAAGVAQALQEVLAPHGLEPALLKAEGRYLEDVY